ncbi:MAG: methylenetetrahydrofolate reductase [Pseudomonadota bacterium]
MDLKSKLDAGKFVILAEMEPPKGVDIALMVANAKAVKGDIDAFVIPEMSNAVMRMSALGGAIVLRQTGVEIIMEVCCRDRNRLALQADLLAAYACGVANVLVTTGKSAAYGDHHQAKEVYDIELIELLHAIQKLQTGKDMSGIDLVGSPRFLTSSTVNASLKGDPLKKTLEDMAKMAEAGVEFFVIPPLFDLDSIKEFLHEADLKKTKIIPTVLLLKSVGMARYIERNIENISIPGSLIERIQRSSDKPKECVNIAAEMANTLKKEGFSGVVFSTIGWEQKLPDIIRQMEYLER